MKNLNDTFQLSNGYKIPCIGYGTYQTPSGDVTVNAVKAAISAGYRHIDTAAFYKNEKDIGFAVQNCGIARENLFITSKVWNTDRGYKSTKAAFEKSLSNLNLSYLDLYLIHWPANKKQFGDKAEQINAQTWRAMEKLYNDGKIKAIGVSNFLPSHINDLLKTANIKPMVNQIEFHPGWAQLSTVNFCHNHNIVVQAWSPLGRKAALENETLKSIAGKYHKTTAQICLRWILQHNILPLPKSITPNRMVENINVFDFTIDKDDINAIDSLQNLGGTCAMPDEVDF